MNNLHCCFSFLFAEALAYLGIPRCWRTHSGFTWLSQIVDGTAAGNSSGPFHFAATTTATAGRRTARYVSEKDKPFWWPFFKPFSFFFYVVKPSLGSKKVQFFFIFILKRRKCKHGTQILSAPLYFCPFFSLCLSTDRRKNHKNGMNIV